MVNWLKRWDITSEELSQILEDRPSLRGMLFGYISEYKLIKLYFTDPRIENLYQPDNHARKEKGDLVFIYKNTEIRVEVKSLQTHTIRRTDEGWKAKFQCDASDRRKVTLPNGDELQTTCLLVGEFDLLAVNLFELFGQWKFAFAKNRDLPRSTYYKYTPEQREYLLATLMEMTWPLRPPFVADPFELLDEIVSEKKVKKL